MRTRWFSLVVGLPRCNERPEILLETLDAIDRSTVTPHVIVIDNGDEPLGGEAAERIARLGGEVIRPERNVGCAGAWNLIYQHAATLTEDDPIHPRVVILNADCAVATDTFERMLAVPAPAVVLAYAFGCFLIDAAVRRQLGEFDAQFYPAYFEDTDYRRRMELAGITPIEWPTMPATSLVPGREISPEGITHGSYDPDGYQGWRAEKLDWFWKCYEQNRKRYVAKWGGEPCREKFTVPFNGEVQPPP